MSLLNDASLILVPSAIKTGEVLVQKPLPNKFADEMGNYDGNDPQTNANLTFTRASSATRVGPDGLIEKVRTNLILQSNSFDTTWVNSNTTETGGQSGYDGTNNAWLLTTTLAGGFIAQSVAISGLTTFSVYAKAGTQNGIILYSAHVGQGINFNLSTGVVGPAFVAPTLGSRIDSIGNGWYRCSITISSSSTSAFRLYVGDGSDVSVGNVVIQNSQAESGDIATDYIATTTAAVSVGPVSGLPRLDYSGGATCPKLLLEGQRTNAIIFSENLDNAAWTKSQTTISANATTSPDGYTNADKIQETAATSEHRVYETTPRSSSGTQTASCFLKAAERSVAVLSLSDLVTGAVEVTFNLSNGTGVDTSSGSWTNTSFTISDYGSGWYRCTITGTQGAGSTSRFNIYTSNGATTNYTGVSGFGLFAWGCQSEASASYATSYIPTLGASVTRLADFISDKNITSFGIGNYYTLFFEIDLAVEDNNKVFYTLKNSVGSESFTIRNFTGGFRAYNNIDAAYPLSAKTSSNGKYVMRVDGNAYSLFYLAGGTATKSPGTLATARNFGFLSFDGDFTACKFSQHLIFPTALTDAQCIELIA